MRLEVYICDHCNADITEHAQKYGDWQTWQAHGGTGSDRVKFDACSLTCLIACLITVETEAVTE